MGFTGRFGPVVKSFCVLFVYYGFLWEFHFAVSLFYYITFLFFIIFILSVFLFHDYFILGDFMNIKILDTTYLGVSLLLLEN